MDNRCRVCQRSEVDELISISCTATTQELRISEMISKTTGATFDDYDRLPKHICDKCLGWLDQTYSVWKRHRVSTLLAKCQKGEEERYYRCRICARNDSDELISLFCICDSWKVSIDKMILFLTKVKAKIGDCLPPYICDSCLKDLDVGYGFKKQYLKSEAAFREEMFFAWEKMAFQREDLGQLQVDLYAELIPNWITQGVASISSMHCSVCKLQIPLDQLAEQCEGCLLDFNNLEDVRLKIEVYGQMDTTDPIGIDSEPDVISLNNDTEPLVASTTSNHTSEIECLDRKGLFEVLEEYSNGPFQRIRRNGPICCGCYMIFLNKDDIGEHMKGAHFEPCGNGDYSCESCHKRFKTLLHLKRHKKRLSQYTFDYCKACQKILPIANNFLIHKEKFHMPIGAAKAAAGKYTVETKSFYECCINTCRRKYEREERLLKHCNSSHYQEEELDRSTCQYCRLQFTKEDDLMEHSNRKVERKTFKCAINGCTLRTKRLDRILYHCTVEPHDQTSAVELKGLKMGQIANISVPARDAAGRYIAVKQVSYRCCGLDCNLRFSTEETLLVHMRMSHEQPKEIDLNTCQHCGKHFTHATVLINHHSNRRLEWMIYLCTVVGCGFKSKTEEYIKKHCIMHTSPKSDGKPQFEKKKKAMMTREKDAPNDGENEKDQDKYAAICHFYYQCCAVDCKNRYKNEELLLQHSNISHYQADSVDPNTCQCCGVKFDQEIDLSQHNSNRKVQWTTYNCTVRGCNFNSKVLETTKLHCSNIPHERYRTKSRVEQCNITPDMKHFTVTGDIDGIIDVLERTTSEVCCACYLFFETSEERLLHYEETHAIIKDNNPFRCGTCNKGFLYDGVLKHHNQFNGSENRTYFYCRPCQTFLWNDMQLKHHKAKEHASSDDRYEQVVEGLFMCCGCEKQFLEEEELIEHRREKHTPPPERNPLTTTCDACQRSFKKMKQLDEHTALYSSKLVYQCKVANCVYQTKKLPVIKIHALGASHRDADGNRLYIYNLAPIVYRCCIHKCGYSDASYDSVIEHGIRDHGPKREENKIAYTGSHNCPVCCRTFETQFRLINHQHGKKKIKCGYCANGFNTREECNDHIQVCKQHYKIICEICSAEQKSRAQLKKHMELEHGQIPKPEPNVVCPVCGKQFTKSHLSTHMNAHENKRQWKCSLCPRAFNQKQMLKFHSRVHGNEKKFECRHGCGNRYKADGDRTRHERQVHFGIKPFKCQCCPETFGRERELRLHSRTHTGLKLYTCIHCQSGFNKKSEFELHKEECELANPL